MSSPFEFYAEALKSHPVIKIPGMLIYAVFSHELVTQVIDRVEDFSNNFSAFMQGRQPNNAEIQAMRSLPITFRGVRLRCWLTWRRSEVIWQTLP